MNLYAYVAGDPLNNTDPTGEAIALPALFVTTVALVGGYIYLQTHPDAVSDLADGISEFAKPSRKNDKEAATDIPSYVKYHPPKGPNESCGEYAERVLKDQFGCDDPRATRKGPRSDYSKIKKNCERSR